LLLPTNSDNVTVGASPHPTNYVKQYDRRGELCSPVFRADNIRPYEAERRGRRSLLKKRKKKTSNEC
jgi:hypothetical protein